MKRRKKKKRGTKIRRVIVILILLVLVLGYIFVFSPIFKVKAVEVSGNKEVSTEQIKQVFSNMNILMLSEEKIKNDLLNKFPKIVEVEIQKNLTKRSINLTVKERERLGIICRMGLENDVKNCFYIDKRGYVFEEAPETSGSLILSIKDYSQNSFDIGEHILSEQAVGFIFRVKEYLFSETDIEPLDFGLTIFPYTDLRVIVSEGWYIVFNLRNDIERQLMSLKTAFSSGPDDLEELRASGELEYIDLRTENRIYYK